MGEDCEYVYGDTPPVSSKACSATYALPDYLIDVSPAVDTRLAFHFMSQEDDCDGGPYTTPLNDLTPLPVTADHAIVRTISDETFEGGLGTHIEGALRGIAHWTAANVTAGREMVGVLMTDGDPSGCEEDIEAGTTTTPTRRTRSTCARPPATASPAPATAPRSTSWWAARRRRT